MFDWSPTLLGTMGQGASWDKTMCNPDSLETELAPIHNPSKQMSSVRN